MDPEEILKHEATYSEEQILKKANKVMLVEDFIALEVLPDPEVRFMGIYEVQYFDARGQQVEFIFKQNLN